MHACKLIINLHLPLLVKSKSIIETKPPIILSKNPYLSKPEFLQQSDPFAHQCMYAFRSLMVEFSDQLL